MERFARLAWILVALASVGVGRAQEVDFARDIRPLLSDNCYHCHGPDESSRGARLRLDTRDGLFRTRRGKAVVAPGDVAASELIRRVRAEDEDDRMPPADSQRRLTDAEITLLERWVEAGAPWEGHWSLQPIVQPEAPAGVHPVDHFVGRRLEREGLRPAPEASKERLLRRVTFDLTGLPPTIEELDVFLADEAPDAYERAVERLLRSPHHGERLAWDWLDAARYADSNGFQGDNERTMWPWRDWVVRAFNANMPYDRFTVWQLAGDLLPEATIEQRLATGFNRNHMINGEGGRIAEENRVEYVFDQMETMGTVWLGLTLQCSRCHDHKFDPISRREYYQLFAFFNQTPVNGGGGDPRTPPNLAYGTPEQEEERRRLESEAEAARGSLASAEAELLAEAEGAATDVGPRTAVREILDRPIAARDEKQLEALQSFGEAERPAYAELVQAYRARKKALEDLERSLPRVMVMADMAQPRKTFLLTKGLYNQPEDEVTADTPAVFPPSTTATDRSRLALARWLVDPAHPLTARVTVNRYWQMLFGRGLVRTTEDFGAQGERPTHPELLDWLAGELIRSGWDLRHILRTIVTSATYRQSSRSTPEAVSRDPDNRLLARGPRGRLRSWMIRDHALAVSGLLVRELGGPPVSSYQPDGVWAEATFGKKRYRRGEGPDLYRRSLYSFWRRIVGPTLFFDESGRQTCSVRPGLTNTPLHALTTLNDVTYIEAARVLARRVMRAASAERERLELAFRLATSRRPSATELTILLSRLDALRAEYASRPEEARQLLEVGEAPRDAELDAVEHAAHAGVCSLILNLDEALSR